MDTNEMLQAVDATLDQAINLVAGTDVTTLPENVAQAIGLLNAAGTQIDEALEALGIDDPDDPETDSNEGEADDGEDPSRSKVKRENLLRAIPGGLEVRSEGDGGGTTLCGYFSVFNMPYEIDSYYEGRFLEIIDPAAFDETIANDQASIRVLYDHGFDPQMGNKPLGPIAVLRADEKGAYYEVPLLDTDYNRDFVLPALSGRLMDGTEVGSQLGASFRFQVLDEVWTTPQFATSQNPEKLEERRITRAKVFEFGPVTFPASPGASSGVRSLTDTFIDRLHHDGAFAVRMTERVGAGVVERMLKTMTGDPQRSKSTPPAKKANASGDAQREPLSKSQRRAKAILAGALVQEDSKC